jgi:hypothetical protein
MTVRRADDNRYTLAENASASGSAVGIKGGQYIFQVEGTAGGTTATLQIKTANGTWANVTSYGVAISATTLPYAASPVELPAGDVRVALTSGTPSAVYAYLIGLG